MFIPPLRRTATTCVAAAATLFFLTLTANAVVVRGRLTDALGRPIPGGHVELQQDRHSLAQARADRDGYFTLRTAGAGRFVLLGTAGGYLPGFAPSFYGSALDVLTKDIVLSTDSVKQEVSVTATGFPTPLPQLTAPVSLVTSEELSTRVGIIDELRQQPGVFLDTTGQYGGQTSMFVRGGPSDGNKVLLDGVPAGDVGGSFDFGTPSSTGIASIETYRGPNSALFGTDSQSSVVNISTPHGLTTHPLLTYSGDAGNLHTWRQEGTVSGTHRKFDYFGGASYFESSNALPNDEYHAVTEALNVGYALTGQTTLRITARNADSNTGLPGTYDFNGLTVLARQADQDLYGSGTLENRTLGNWHNLVRYGISRKREQETSYGQQGTFNSNDYTYYGNVVTVQGANGYSATGQAAIYQIQPSDTDSNRDELYYQSDYTFPKHIAVLFGFRYEDERGSFNYYDNPYPEYSEFYKTTRTNFEYNLQIQGDIKNRLFYSVGGSVQKNHLYGIAGEPRIGIAYVPVRPGRGWFHGTKLRANAATGVQEPSITEEFDSIFRELRDDGDTRDIALLGGIGPLGPERSRTFDVGIDQNILSDSLILKAGFFHNQYSHQLEYISSTTLQNDFDITPVNDANFIGATLNSLAYRAMGFESELDWQPLRRLFVRGGYTYLDAVTEQSFNSDEEAIRGGYPNTNPNFPNIPIGANSPLVGARPFRRPPHTGFFAATYSGNKWGVSLKGTAVSRSDDSTFLAYSSPGFTNALLLPNRNLDYGYVKLDLGATYPFYRQAVAFAQFENLLNNQHIGPIGYPGLPLTFRAGVKVHFGGGR